KLTECGAGEAAIGERLEALNEVCALLVAEFAVGIRGEEHHLDERLELGLIEVARRSGELIHGPMVACKHPGHKGPSRASADRWGSSPTRRIGSARGTRPPALAHAMLTGMGIANEIRPRRRLGWGSACVALACLAGCGHSPRAVVHPAAAPAPAF